ncbi:MAG: hypothetical protein VB144_15095 [Clostridia bacterium]|nr:hypothetical protein [Clostridia bacterium]
MEFNGTVLNICAARNVFTQARSKVEGNRCRTHRVVIYVKRAIAVVMCLLVAVCAIAVSLRMNLRGITSRAIEHAISRATGVEDVGVGAVEPRGFRSLRISNVRIGDAISISELTITYDLRGLLRDKVNPGRSITAMEAGRVRLDWPEMQLLASGDGGGGRARLNGLRSDRGASRAAQSGSAFGGFRGTISVRDAEVKLAGGANPTLLLATEVRAALGQPLALSPGSSPDRTADAFPGSSWNVSAERVEYAAETPFVVGRPQAVVSITPSGKVQVSGLGAELLGGRVERASALLDPAGARFLTSAGAVLSRISYRGVAFTGDVEIREDGSAVTHAIVDLPQDLGGPAHVDASFVGRVALGLDAAVPGVAKTDPLRLSAKGDLHLNAVRTQWGEWHDLKASVEIMASMSGIRVDAGAKRTSLSDLAAGGGASGVVSGWVNWSAGVDVRNGCAQANVDITDGLVKTPLWSQEFQDIAGRIEIANTDARRSPGERDVAGADLMHGIGAVVHVPSLRGTIGGGQAEVAGAPGAWRIILSGARLEHQLLRGQVNADLLVQGGASDGLILSGDIHLSHAEVDAVTAGFSQVPSLPDAVLDLDLQFGDDVKIVRDGSWAIMAPGSIKLGGSVRNPKPEGVLIASGGAVELSGVPLEIVSGRIDFPGKAGGTLQFGLEARDMSAEPPIVASITGEPGKVSISMRSDAAEETDQGGLLMKLLDARLRLYMLSGIGRLLDESVDSSATVSSSRTRTEKESVWGSRIGNPTISP